MDGSGSPTRTPAALRLHRRYAEPSGTRTSCRSDSAKHFDRKLNDELLDITCAACHTGQLHVTRNGKHDRGSHRRRAGDARVHRRELGHFVPDMIASMISTLANPLKFNRFARKVLGDRSPGGQVGAAPARCADVLRQLGATGVRRDSGTGSSPTDEGFGRTDALARIANTVFGEHLDPANYEVGDAPVSYPPVWNIWKFDWVQYNASVSQPMAQQHRRGDGRRARSMRCVEPLRPAAAARASASAPRRCSTTSHTIETTLRKLQPPAWPEALLGAIDRAKAERGKAAVQRALRQLPRPVHRAAGAEAAQRAAEDGRAIPSGCVKNVCIGGHRHRPEHRARTSSTRTVDLTRTGLTADDLRRVARRRSRQGKARQADVPDDGEIARAAGGRADRRRRRKPSPRLQAELADLDAADEQALSTHRSAARCRPARRSATSAR